MDLKDISITELADLTASKSPAPGGGAIAAMTGAYGAALTAMVARLTIGKKGFDDVQSHMEGLARSADDLRATLLDAIQKDSSSFDAFMDALRMPKETEEEKVQRKLAMQEALKHAAEVPYQTALDASKIMPLAELAVQEGNPQAVTDALVAAMMARTAVRSALLNVKINLESITDEAYVAEMRDKCQNLEGDVVKYESHILSLVPELAYCRS